MQFTTSRGSIPDGKRFFQADTPLVLTLRADCSLVTLKPAHLSPYLPDHKLAFAQYEQGFRPIVSRVQKQAGASARFLVPATSLGLWVLTHLIPRLVPP